MARGAGTALAVTLAWSWWAGLCPAAQAQAPDTALPNGAPNAVMNFDIPAQPMASALNTWAVQANAQVFVDPGPVAHLTAPAVRGSFTPRQALRALLSRSNLLISQGANGIFVIKPRPAVAAAPAAPAPPEPEVAAAAPEVPVAHLGVRDTEGAWEVGASARYALDRDGATGGATGALTGEYFLSDQWSMALAIAAPRTHSFDGGSARLQTSVLDLKYYFMPENRLRPYLGAGLNVTAFSDAENLTGLSRVSAGPALETGLDFTISPRWTLNAAIGWTQVRPGATGSTGRDAHLDPVQFGLGFLYRFGR